MKAEHPIRTPYIHCLCAAHRKIALARIEGNEANNFIFVYKCCTFKVVYR